MMMMISTRAGLPLQPGPVVDGLNMSWSAPYSTDMYVPGYWVTPSKEIGNTLSYSTIPNGNDIDNLLVLRASYWQI
jgi:hypothetical protein